MPLGFASTGSRPIGDGSIAAVKLAPEIPVLAAWAGGSSDSGTAGTVIAEISATAGRYFATFIGFLAAPNDANSQTRVVFTFTDDTTETITDAGTNIVMSVTRDGLVRLGSPTRTAAVDRSKKVKKVSLQTASTGTVARVGNITGWEADYA